MAGIAVFPTPARKPAMSSLPLAVERGWPSLPCTHRPVPCSFDQFTPLPYTYITAERPVSTTLPRPLPVLNQSINLPQSAHTNTDTNTNKLSASRGILHSHIQHGRGISRQSLRRQSEPLFHSPSPPVSSTSPVCMPSVGTCQQHRAAVAISGPSRYI